MNTAFHYAVTWIIAFSPLLAVAQSDVDLGIEEEEVLADLEASQVSKQEIEAEMLRKQKEEQEVNKQLTRSIDKSKRESAKAEVELRRTETLVDQANARIVELNKQIATYEATFNKARAQREKLAQQRMQKEQELRKTIEDRNKAIERLRQEKIALDQERAQRNSIDQQLKQEKLALANLSRTPASIGRVARTKMNCRVHQAPQPNSLVVGEITANKQINVLSADSKTGWLEIQVNRTTQGFAPRDCF